MFGPFWFERCATPNCTALCLYRCRLRLARSPGEVPWKWKAPARTSEPYHNSVCHIGYYNIFDSGKVHQVAFLYAGITVYIQASGGAVSVVARTTKDEQLGSHVRTDALPLLPQSEQFSHLDISWRSDYPTDLFSYLYTNLLAFCVPCTQIRARGMAAPLRESLVQRLAHARRSTWCELCRHYRTIYGLTV